MRKSRSYLSVRIWDASLNKTIIGNFFEITFYA